jgi:uncharacterized membrane protein
MLLAAITAYSVSVFIHITAVVVGFGATFAEAIMFPVAQKLDPKHLPYVHRLQMAINQRLATPALVVVIVTGIYQVSDGGWGFGEFWISATFLIVIVIGGLLGAYFVPSDRRLGAQVEHDLAETGAPSAGYLAAARKQGAVGAFTGLLLVLAIFLMVTKPGA